MSTNIPIPFVYYTEHCPDLPRPVSYSIYPHHVPLPFLRAVLASMLMSVCHSHSLVPADSVPYFESACQPAQSIAIHSLRP